MREIPGKKRLGILKLYFEDYSYDEIAKATAVFKGSVVNIIRELKEGNKRRALITGVTGFVGPYLAKKLLEHGYEVYGLTRRRAEGYNYRRLTSSYVESPF